jgi:hypothetical protein
MKGLTWKGGELKSHKQKKTWQKPELVVLVRNRPEEAILQDCKNWDVLGPQDANDRCMNVECLSSCIGLSSS